MGIRINNNLGFGLDDYQGDDDSRFKMTMDEFMEITFDHDLDEFLTFLKLKYVNDDYDDDFSIKLFLNNMGDTAKKKATRLSKGVVYMPEEELGLSNVVLFQALDMPEWHRYGNIMDSYMHEVEHGGSMNCVCREIRGGIYPYMGQLINHKNGQRIRLEDNMFLYKFYDQALTGDDPGIELPLKIEKYGIYSKDDIDKYVRPEIPLIIRAYVKFFDLMDDEDINYLKPLFYRYWS